MFPLSVILLLALPSCDPAALNVPGGVIEQTDNLSIRSAEDTALCSGTALKWQDQWDLMSRIAGQDVPEIVDIYVTQDASAYCTLSRLGCAQTGTDPKSAIGRPSVMPHEIAHVFEDTVTPGAMPAAYEEGFAEMFSGYGGVLPRDSFLSLMQADSATDLNYSSARHLTRWLVSQYGIESLFTLYQRSARNDDTVQRLAEFERTLDTTWMDLQMEFWRTAALYDPGPRECAIVDGTVSAKEGLIMSIPLDCESDGTFGPFNLEEEPGGQIASERVIEVAESGRYWLEASRGRVRLLPCEVRNEAMDAAFWGALDAGFDAIGVMTTFRRYQSVELRTGRYILTVLDGLASEEAPVVVAVQLDRPLSIEAP